MGKRLGVRATIVLAILAIGCNSQTLPSGGPDNGAAASVEIVPGAVLLTKQGQTQKVAAVVHDRAGVEVKGPPTLAWTSSDPAVVSVAPDGTITAAVAVGSATIVAKSGALASKPATITIATPVSGAVLLTDPQIIDGPTLVDPQASEPGAQYDVTLRDVTGLTAGAIVINTQAKVVAGRVVSTEASGSDTKTRLEIVPPKALFTAFSYRDTFEIKPEDVELDDRLAAFFDIERTGGTIKLTPKVGATGATPGGGSTGATPGGATLASWNGSGSGAGRAASAAAQGTRALGPFACGPEEEAEGDDSELPFGLSAGPLITINFAGAVTRELTEQGTKVLVSATPTVSSDMTLEAKVAFEVEYGCKMYIGHRRVPAPLGWVGMFAGGIIDYGLGFTIGGEFTLGSIKAGASLSYAPNFSLAMTCPATGACDFSRQDQPTTATIEPKLELPELGQQKVEPKLEIFAFLEFRAGVTIFDFLLFSALEAKIGIEFAGSLTLEALQIADTDGEEGSSNYELAVKAEVGPAIEFESFLSHFGLDEIVPLAIEAEVPLGESPKGRVSSPKGAWAPGETAEFTVNLQAASTVFPAGFGIYNVASVALVVADDTNPLEVHVLASKDATAGQTELIFSFEVEEAIASEDVYAFVVTKLPLHPVQYEMAKASVPIKFTFDRDLDGWIPYGLGPRSNTEPWGTAKWYPFDGGGGAARISGIGGEGRINAAISKSIALPANTTKLRFKASADQGHDFADSFLRVRLAAANGGQRFFEGVIANTTGALNFQTIEVDIAAYAGQTVTLIFEQDDNGDHLHEHVILDDIEIVTSE